MSIRSSRLRVDYWLYYEYLYGVLRREMISWVLISGVIVNTVRLHRRPSLPICTSAWIIVMSKPPISPPEKYSSSKYSWYGWGFESNTVVVVFEGPGVLLCRVSCWLDWALTWGVYRVLSAFFLMLSVYETQRWSGPCCVDTRMYYLRGLPLS